MPSAQIVQLNGITDTTTGIAYRVKTRQIYQQLPRDQGEDHTILADASSGAITVTPPWHEHGHEGARDQKKRRPAMR